jgi:hypothetical protein
MLEKALNKPPNRECFLGALVRPVNFSANSAIERPTLVEAGMAFPSISAF